MNWRTLARYFIHGMAFSFLFFVLSIAWVFAAISLVNIGALIGLVIGVVLLFLLVGFINSIITTNLWFRVRSRFWDLLFHGIALSVVLLALNGITISLPNFASPGIATSIITFVIAAFLDGFAAVKLAGYWRAECAPWIRVLRAEKMSGRRLAFALSKNALAIIIELAIIFPIVWIVSASFRSYGSLLTTTLQIIPPHPTLEAYSWALALNSPFWPALTNSLLVSLFTTGFCLLVASPAAYAMSRFRFLGKRPILYALIFIQFVPGLLMFIAFFYLLLFLKLYDNLFGLALIYVALVLPFDIWNLKAFFDTLPKDIDEAALIDGASYWGAMFRVVLPLAAPGMAVTAFFSFLTAWNEFALANVILGSEANYTLPLRLYALTQRDIATNWPHFAALSILSSIPLVIVFMVIQRYLRAGLAIGAVKG